MSSKDTHLRRWDPWRKEVNSAPNVLRHTKSGSERIYGTG